VGLCSGIQLGTVVNKEGLELACQTLLFGQWMVAGKAVGDGASPERRP